MSQFYNIIGSKWFHHSGGTIGMVAIKSRDKEGEYWKCYIGPTYFQGLLETIKGSAEIDEQWIAGQGGKVDEKIAKAAFPHIKLRFKF